MSRAFFDQPVHPLCPGCPFNVVCATTWQQGMVPRLRDGMKVEECYRYLPLALTHKQETGFNPPATGDELLVQLGKTIGREERVVMERQRIEELYSWWDDELAVLDFESTGTDPYTARPVSVALLMVEPDGAVRQAWSVRCLVNAGVPIPEDAGKVHGITAAEVQLNGRVPADVVQELHGRLDELHRAGAPLVIFNAPYDHPLALCEAQRCEVTLPPVALIDPLCLDRHFAPYRKGGRKLAQLAPVYGVTLELAHDAGADAVAAVAIARAQVKAHPELKSYTLAQLHQAQANWHDQWKTSLNAWWVKKGVKKVIKGSWPIGLGGPAPTPEPAEAAA